MRLKREDYLYSRAQWTLEKESARHWWQNKAQVEICTEHRLIIVNPRYHYYSSYYQMVGKRFVRKMTPDLGRQKKYFKFILCLLKFGHNREETMIRCNLSKSTYWFLLHKMDEFAFFHWTELDFRL